MANQSHAERPALIVENISRTYGEGDSAIHALQGVSVAFVSEQFTAIMGPSGSGKSTLMHCAAGLDRPDSGAVYLGEVDLTRLSDDRLTRLRREQIGFVFQSFNLLPTLTAQENIMLPLRLARRRQDPAWYDKIIRVLGIEDRMRHRPSELSGGQQQRVAVARALVTRPHVIFADEPTGALDQKAGLALLEFLRRCTDELGQCIIMVTHDPAAAAWADRIITLTDGRIVRDAQKDLT